MTTTAYRLDRLHGRSRPTVRASFRRPVATWRRAIAVAVVLFALPITNASAATVGGSVTAAGKALAGAHVSLYGAGASAATKLGTARTSSRGTFTITYRRPSSASVLYVIANGGGSTRLLAVAGSSSRVTVNELTTVAGAYAMAQFLHGTKITGPAPGPPNAAMTVAALVDQRAGTVGEEVANTPNGTETSTLATLRTLAAILAGCTGGRAQDCTALFRAATPAGRATPQDTLAAIHAIALHPAEHVNAIFRLRKSGYATGLASAPSSWVLSLKHTDGGFDGPGRIAFDSKGNVWSTNNFESPGVAAGLGVVSLDPAGHPRNGSPVTGGGVQGNWWGIAVDLRDRVWLSNFTGNDPNDYTSPQFQGGVATSLFTSSGQPVSPSGGFTGGALHAPQGIAVDLRGNVWIANHGNSTVTMYPGGDPSLARVISGGGLYNPFAVEVDGHGNVWVDNGSLDEQTEGSVTKITPDGVAIGPFAVPAMRSPQGMAFDSAGNLWIASLVDTNVTELGADGRVKGQFRVPSIRGAWSVAIDGNDNVWVASFIGQTLTQLCGRIVAHCPPGSKTGDAISPPLRGFTNGGLQHVTATQVDPSGNVWVANNWVTLKPVAGGDGLVEFIGAAAPVAAPLIGLPRRP